MAQGILGGIALGAVFSVGLAGALSLLVPMQPSPAPQVGSTPPDADAQSSAPQATVIVTGEGNGPQVLPRISLRTPAGEELPKEPDAAARAPQTTTSLGGAQADGATISEPVSVPEREAVASPSAPSALPPMSGATDGTPDVPAAIPQPQTGQATDLTQPRPLPEGLAARAGEDAPVLPNPQALAPMIPDDSPDADIAAVTAPQTEAQPAIPAQDPQTNDAPVVVEQTPETTGEPEAEPLPEQEPVETAQAPKPRVLTVPGTPVGTLGSVRPRVGTPAKTLIDPTSDDDAAPVENETQTTDTDEDTRPVRAYAQPFENPEGKPLMGIVLMDTGVDLDAAAIGLPALSSFPYPVSFAVDASLQDAAERVERYRAEGFDVLAMVNLPQGARPTDAEVSLSVVLDGMPEIVGVLEGTGVGLQGSREVADQVTRILAASGHGLVAQSKGLDSMPKLALKEGVPAAPIFRDFDSEGQQPRVIRRFLDQAAFKAGQEGGVIMLGRLRPETIEALLVWGLADRAGSVALAPVSAVLLAQ